MTEQPSPKPFTPALSWQHSKAWAAALIALYVSAALAGPVLANLLAPGGAEPLHELGLMTALAGFSILALQTALSARFRPVDRAFGHDVVLRFHKAMAALAGALLIAHPLLIAASGDAWVLFSLEMPWTINLGQAALVLAVGAIICSFLVGLLKLPYQAWRVAHKGVIAIVLLGFIHSMSVGDDLEPSGMRAYWSVLFGAAAAIFLYRNIYVPVWGRRRFRVVSVTPESHDTYTVRLAPADGKPVPARNPGQFQFLRLVRPGRGSEEHPFTISAAAGDETLASTIKESGDFTNTIARTREGDLARIEAPFGRFSYVHHDPAELLLVAGGVGITPIVSMLRTLRDSGDRRAAVLVYGNKTEKDILFREELEGLGEHVRVVHVLSQPDTDWNGPAGYVTREIIAEHAGELLAEAHAYVCGPPVMMDKVVAALRELGVDDRRIHFERFCL